MNDNLRLDVRRLDSVPRWVFHILGQDGRTLSGEPKETYATRREATRAGEAALGRFDQQSPGRRMG